VFFFQAVTVAFDVENGGTVKEAVESGAGQDGVIGEDLPPIGEGFVGSDDDGVVALVAVADDLEEHAGLGGVQAMRSTLPLVRGR